MFPSPVCDNAKLNPVQESLKSRNLIYQVIRTDSEVRVNDYNPLLLLLWKANIDIQYVAESSLALAHYVSGYVTKAEQSNMQEIWQDVFTAGSGALVFGFESVVSMRQVISCLEITSVRSLHCQVVRCLHA